jgi:chromosome segregation ATPase
MENRISRIRKMERSYNRVRKAAESLERALEVLEQTQAEDEMERAQALQAIDRTQARMDALAGEISRLQEYQSSGLWLQDFEADERGELPADLRRGVLSEDGLYNLLEDIKQK